MCVGPAAIELGPEKAKSYASIDRSCPPPAAPEPEAEADGDASAEVDGTVDALADAPPLSLGAAALGADVAAD